MKVEQSKQSGKNYFIETKTDSENRLLFFCLGQRKKIKALQKKQVSFDLLVERDGQRFCITFIVVLPIVNMSHILTIQISL